MIRVQSEPFEAASELAAFAAEAGSSGAIVSFVGIVRGGDTERLELSHFAGFTEAAVEAIAAEALKRFDITDVTIVHRIGSLAPGEPIVFAAAASAHRRAAFEATDYLMDRLKTDAPLWKKEVGAAGERWIEPTPADRGDRKRWEDADAARDR